MPLAAKYTKISSQRLEDLNPKLYLKGLPRAVPDHCLLLLTTESQQGGV